MRQAAPPGFIAPDVYIERSRVIAPNGEPVLPPSGYWATSPVRCRTMYVEHEQTWHPGPVYSEYEHRTPCRHMLPPVPPYRPCVYNQNYSLRCHYPVANDILEKRLVLATPNSSYDTFSGINPSESPVKQRSLINSSWEESSNTPTCRLDQTKYKRRKNLIDEVEVEIKEKNKNYKYKESDNQLHPEVLAIWRKSINKSKESSNTHKVKIEIYLKNEKITENTDDRKKVTQENELKKSGREKHSPKMKQQIKEMSSSHQNDKRDSAVEEKLGSQLVSSARDEKYSEKTSPHESTPVQITKVRTTDDSVTKRKNNSTPDPEIRERCRWREKYEGSSRRNRDFIEPHRKSSVGSRKESHRSYQVTEQKSETDVETYRSGEKRSLSSARSSTTDRSSSSQFTPSPQKTYNPIKTAECNTDSDPNSSQNSSIYVTPEGTPFSMRSKGSEERYRSSFKRSFSDEYDDGQSANSSFNNSGYFTPESSPSQFNPAKRLKTRWSSSESYYGLDNTSFLSSGHNDSSVSDQGVQPELIGYQMVGDSQFCRFGQQLLGLSRVPMPNSPGRIGICVSGQTITDLHKRVKDNFYPISDKIILMIGTNDFLRNVEVKTMCEELSALVRTLQKSVSNIILLTLPPIPKLEKKSTTHLKMLDAYNSHIRSLENGETLRIADVSPLYMTSPPHQRCRMHLFEVYFSGRNKRLDLIHLNRLGLEIIRKYILDKFI